MSSMESPPPKQFRLLSEEEFWKLSSEEKLRYLKTAFEVSSRHTVKPQTPPPAKKTR